MAAFINSVVRLPTLNCQTLSKKSMDGDRVEPPFLTTDRHHHFVRSRNDGELLGFMLSFTQG